MLKLTTDIKEANYITHNGKMHADEVFATAFLELYVKDVRLFRTSDVENKEKDVVFMYDIGRGRYDHHQLDAKKRENGIKYCSLGLLWQKYGREYLKKIKVKDIEEVFSEIDTKLIEQIDAIDNGVFPKVEAPYKIKTLCDIIDLFNPGFDSNEVESEQFLKAARVAKIIFKEEIINAIGRVKARKIVKENIKNAKNHMLILEKSMPYEDAILGNSEADSIYFVIFPSNRGGYAIKPVIKSKEDKTYRKSPPSKWGGLSSTELQKITGISGFMFCHSTLFLLTTATKKAAIEVVEKILEYD